MREGKRKIPESNKAHLIELIHYVASGNPHGVRSMAYKFGYPAYNSYKGSIRFLLEFLQKEGEKGFDELMVHHPDKDIILEIGKPENTLKNDVSLYSNFLSSNLSGQHNKQLADRIELIILTNKDQVKLLLEKHGIDTDEEISKESLTNLIINQINKKDKAFTYDLNTLFQVAENSNITSEFAPIVGLIGKVAGKLIKAPKDKSAEEALIQLNESKLRQQKLERNNQIIISIAVILSTLILVLFIIHYFK